MSAAIAARSCIRYVIYSQKSLMYRSYYYISKLSRYHKSTIHANIMRECVADQQADGLLDHMYRSQ